MDKIKVLFVLIFLSDFTIALDYNSQAGVDGYWNYEIIVKTETANVTQTFTIEPLPKSEDLMRMHPQQLQKLLKEWRQHAIYTSEIQDVSEYLRVQDVIRQKALAFTAVAGFVVQQNPNLSLNDEIPMTNTGRQIKFNNRQDQIDQYLDSSVEEFGFLYFHSRTCNYCVPQESILKQILNNFNFDIEVVDVDKKPVLTSKFGIQQTPSIIIVGRRTKDYLPVAHGLTSLPELKENIYRAIRYIRKEIKPQQFFTDEQDIGTGLDPETDNEK